MEGLRRSASSARGQVVGWSLAGDDAETSLSVTAERFFSAKFSTARHRWTWTRTTSTATLQATDATDITGSRRSL